jgi:hypothetical protein
MAREKCRKRALARIEGTIYLAMNLDVRRSLAAKGRIVSPHTFLRFPALANPPNDRALQRLRMSASRAKDLGDAGEAAMVFRCRGIRSLTALVEPDSGGRRTRPR